MTEQELERLARKYTDEYRETPLFYVTFNLEKYLKEGEKGSCDLRLHPLLNGDEFIVKQLNSLVDHIRKNYDMEKVI